MDTHAILENVLNPPVLFFFLGMGVVFFKSDLVIPESLSKFFSMYLLFAIGFKGGHELSKTAFSQEHLFTLIACSIMAIIVPIYAYFVLKIKLDKHNAAALARFLWFHQRRHICNGRRFFTQFEGRIRRVYRRWNGSDGISCDRNRCSFRPFK